MKAKLQWDENNTFSVQDPILLYSQKTGAMDFCYDNAMLQTRALFKPGELSTGYSMNVIDDQSDF